MYRSDAVYARCSTAPLWRTRESDTAVRTGQT